MHVIYTIGHSNHSIDHFVAMLQQYKIAAVADVRSVPYSKFNPQFNQKTLEESLHEAEIEYMFLGNELGARLPSYYDNFNKPNYPRMKQRKEFKNGIQQLLRDYEKYNISLMCSEKNPQQCHREHLICSYLRDVHHIRIQHILPPQLATQPLQNTFQI